ncbi:MAG: L-2-amino-thiazoline-4-carboxylic acid hydrolase [Rhodothermales bacterium]|nr:L-2-amino-thiazoline-4-carboxylic acid hydrolase [Rhodothermales bacterium]MBO6779196.1 L-2-amino-thiazoline-4-carboxylic acid hydrolase [Rhodothermales bacterium]
MSFGRLLLPPGVAYRRAAQEALADRPVDAQTVLAEMRRAYARTESRYSFGVNLLLRYFDWSRALYASALEAGLDADEAGRLVQDTHWRLFRPVFVLLNRVSRLRSRRLRTRVQWMLDLSFRTVFTAPFERELLASGEGIAFDVVRCPIAEYFRDHGMPELTRHAACSLDWRMAELWGVLFERTQTIAAGADSCDFRYQMPDHVES